MLVPCLKKAGLRFTELGEIDLAIASEHILLEITELGLGGVWLAVTPVPDRMEKANAALGIGDQLSAFALIPVGYPAKERPQQDRFDEGRIHYLD